MIYQKLLERKERMRTNGTIRLNQSGLGQYCQMFYHINLTAAGCSFEYHMEGLKKGE